MATDFLQQCATSSFTLDGFATIHFLVIRDEASTKTSNGALKPPPPTRTSRVVQVIRDADLPVVWDTMTMTYWIFSPSKIQSLADPVLSVISETTKLHSSLFASHVEAKALVAAFQYGQLSTTIKLQPFALPVQSVAEQMPQADQGIDQTRQIWDVSVNLLKFFQDSVSELLSYKLVTKNVIQPLFKQGSRSNNLVYSDSRSSSAALTTSQRPAEYTFSWQVLLVSSGIILVTYNTCTNDPSWIPLNQTDSQPGITVSTGLHGRRAILVDCKDLTASLAALGVASSAIVVNTHSDLVLRPTWRKSITIWLASQGITVDVDQRWTCLVFDAPPRKEQPDRKGYVIVEWPTKLCYGQPHDQSVDQSQLTTRVDAVNDPFDFITDWLDVKHTQEGQMLSDSPFVPKSEDADATEPAIKFDYDFQSPAKGDSRSNSSSQQVAGPYPTPPAASITQHDEVSQYTADSIAVISPVDTAISQAQSQAMLLASQNAGDSDDIIMTDDLFGDDIDDIGDLSMADPDLSFFDSPKVKSEGDDNSADTPAALEMPDKGIERNLMNEPRGSPLAAGQVQNGDIGVSHILDEPETAQEDDATEVAVDSPSLEFKTVRFSDSPSATRLDVGGLNSLSTNGASLYSQQDDKYSSKGKFGRIARPSVSTTIEDPKSPLRLKTDPSSLSYSGSQAETPGSATRPYARASSLRQAWDSDSDTSSEDDEPLVNRYNRMNGLPPPVQSKNSQTSGKDSSSQVSPEKSVAATNPSHEMLAASFIHLFFGKDPPQAKLRMPHVTQMERSFVKFCSSVEDPKELIIIAQLVSEHGRLKEAMQTLELQRDTATGARNSSSQPWVNQLKLAAATFGELLPQDLPTFMSLRDELHNRPSTSISQSRPPSRPGSSGASLAQQKPIQEIPAAPIRVKKDGDRYVLSPPSLSFWHTLGLEPLNGPKNIQAYCIFPENLTESTVSRFLHTLGNAYSTFGLGQHNSDETDGLLSVPMFTEESPNIFLNRYRTACEKLGSLLVQSEETVPWTLVYLINPFSHPASVQALCTCFRALVNAVHASRKTYNSQIVLQLLPDTAFTSLEYICADNSEFLAQFTRTIYDKCRKQADSLQQSWSHVEIDEESHTSGIHFQLVDSPPYDLFKEKSPMHLAYARSSDGQWMTASWADGHGRVQYDMAYSLHKRRLAEVMKEMWDTTLDLLKRHDIHWSLFVVKCGRFDDAERTFWPRLFKTGGEHITCSLLYVETDPIISFTPQQRPEIVEESPVAVAPTPRAAYATPSSTPRAFGSPAATPGQTGPLDATNSAAAVDSDPSARLVDVTDDSWSVILGHQLDASASVLSTFCTYASGYLVKRSSPHDTDPPVILEVGLVYWDEMSKAGPEIPQARYDAFLRSILLLYRQLALLARARGLEHPRLSTTPLHIAAAMRGARELERCMVWP